VPRYDYDCAACGARSELVHGVYADPPTNCPVCGAGPLKKAFAPPTIHFKGTGWAKKERRAGSAAGGRSSDGETAGVGADGNGTAEKSAGAGAGADSAGDTKTSTSGSESGKGGKGGTGGRSGDGPGSSPDRGSTGRSTSGSESGSESGSKAPAPSVPSTSGSSAG
jgi:putative FmdB family regulatory protein